MKNHRDFAGLPPIKVVGVGGGGCNAINRMAQAQIPGVELVAVNTDGQALMHIQADIQIRIGDKLTKGLGVGGDPVRGERAAEESRDELRDAVRGAEMVFVTAGMGGGTGTGAAPIVAEVAREVGALTIGVVTKPFGFEGTKRAERAEEGIAEMRKHVDTMIVVPNERLLAVAGKGMSFVESLKKADEVLLNATRGISELISRTGLINVDFADVRTVMQNGGSALMGTGVGKGESRAMEAAQQAISSPLLDNISVNGATGVLVNITGGNDLSLGEVTQVSEIIHDSVGDEAEVIFGSVIEPSMEGEIRVTVIATGFDRKEQQAAGPVRAPGVIQFPQRQPGVARVSGTAQQQAAAGGAGAAPVRRPSGAAPGSPVQPPVQSAEPLSDMEIPTFIRRQMD